MILVAQVDFRAKVSQREVQLGQRFQVEFSVNEEGRNFKAPSFQGFRVLSGPNYSVNTYMDNTGTRFKLSYSYVLSAKKIGEYSIDPAFIRVDGTTYKTEPINIKVVAQKSKPQSKNRELVFLEALANKTEVYQGEAIYANFRLYFRTKIGQHQFTDEPDFQGLYHENIKLKRFEEKVVNLDGQEYYAADLRRLVLIPQKSGLYEPGKVELSLPVAYKTGRRDFFGRPQYNMRDESLVASFPNLKVKPLPSKGRPQNFSGAVGQFNMETDISSTEINTDGSISLKIRIEGKGNIKLCDLPKVKFPSAFEVFDPEIKEKSWVGSFGMRGYKEIEYLLVPRYSGTYKIELVTFSYFDPRKEKYIRLESETFKINVKGGMPQAGASNNAQPPQGEAQESVDFINKDILFIKTKSKNWQRKNQAFLGSRLFWIIIGLMLITGLGLIGLWWRMRSELENRDNLRMQRAGKAAKKKLQKARKALNAGETEVFYQELETAVYGFFSDKFNLGVSQLSKEYLVQRLSEAGATETQVESILDLLQKSEMARYTGLKIDAATQDFEQAIKVLTEIDKHLWKG